MGAEVGTASRSVRRAAVQELAARRLRSPAVASSGERMMRIRGRR